MKDVRNSLLYSISKFHASQNSILKYEETYIAIKPKASIALFPLSNKMLKVLERLISKKRKEYNNTR
jgi:hypothetical protein